MPHTTLAAESGSDTQLTSDEIASMAWWNACTLQARSYWLEQAKTGELADAWAAYKARPERGEAIRVCDGIRVSGRDLSVTISAGSDGLLHVNVDAEPSATGFGEACRLGTYDSVSAFPPSEVHLSDDGLECFAPSNAYPGFKEGFKTKLEPKMVEPLRHWLQLLGASAALAEAMATAVQAALGDKPVIHLQSFTSELAARIVLDRQPPKQALREQIASHWASQEPDFIAAFQGAPLQQLMAGGILDGDRVNYWNVDGTSLTLVTDADVPLGLVRENMRQDMAREKHTEGTLRRLHQNQSFQGICGTQVYGQGWKLHMPDGDSHIPLWEAVRLACVAEWSEAEQADRSAR